MAAYLVLDFSVHDLAGFRRYVTRRACARFTSPSAEPGGAC
jgi:hypothetical protein